MRMKKKGEGMGGVWGGEQFVLFLKKDILKVLYLLYNIIGWRRGARGEGGGGGRTYYQGLVG